MRFSTVSRFPPICFPYFLSLGIFCLNFFLLQLENNLFDKNYQLLSLKIILRIKITCSALSVNSPQADERLTTLQSSALVKCLNIERVKNWRNVWTLKECKIGKKFNIEKCKVGKMFEHQKSEKLNLGVKSHLTIKAWPAKATICQLK